MRLDRQEGADDPHQGENDREEVVDQRLEYVGPSPAGCPMFWYTTPSTGVGSGRRADVGAAGSGRSSREQDGPDR